MRFYADIDRKIEAVKASRARAVAEGHHASIRVYDGWLANLYEQRANIRQHEASQPPPDTSTPLPSISLPAWPSKMRTLRNRMGLSAASASTSLGRLSMAAAPAIPPRKARRVWVLAQRSFIRAKAGDSQAQRLNSGFR